MTQDIFILLIVALFTRAWIEITNSCVYYHYRGSPSSRGRGLKCNHSTKYLLKYFVALFTRAWIEMSSPNKPCKTPSVALFTRAWIEMFRLRCSSCLQAVALFTRAWIEMGKDTLPLSSTDCRPLHEGVD